MTLLVQPMTPSFCLTRGSAVSRYMAGWTGAQPERGPNYGAAWLWHASGGQMH